MKRFEMGLLLIAVLSVSAPGAEPKEDRPHPDHKSLQGHWQATRMVWTGDEIPAKSVEKLRLEVTERWYLPSRGPIKWLERGKTRVEAELPEMDGVWEIDATKDPKTIAIRRPQGPDLAFRLPLCGIYKLEKDTLTVCFGSFGKQPVSLEDKNALQIVVDKRVPAAKVQPAK
jgi:uncharacterized protein (TIGR03067 family)